MISGFDKLVELYLKSIKILNISTFIIAMIAAGISIWLSQIKETKKSSIAILLSFIYPGLGHIYIRQYFIGGVYILATLALIGISTPLVHVHYLFALSASLRYKGASHLFLILILWIHSIWFVNRMIQSQKRMEFMTAMYKELHEEILEKKKIK